MRRFRRPSAIVWAVAVPFALLVGLAIGGTPNTGKDVPLKDRDVVVAPADAPSTTSAPG